MNKKYRLNKNKKRTINRELAILIGLAILFVVYRSFFKIETIGRDSRYLWFIFVIPTVLGIVILGYMKREFLKSQINEAKGIFQKGFLIFLYLIQGFLFSYTSLGLFANVVWDNFNKKTADLNYTEIIECKITRINSGTSRSSPSVCFMLHDKSESISIDHETYGKYYDSKPTDLKLQISVRKGIWNYYVLDEWEIINNR